MDFSIEEYGEEINLTIIEDGDLLEFSVEETVEEINLTIEEYNGADGIGLKGDKPDHEWNGTQLRFENPDDSWGEYVDLKGEDGLSGIQSIVPGDNITIDNTDPLNPIISAEEGGTNVTKTSDLLNDGQDGTHPFITEADIPAPFEFPAANPGDVLVRGAEDWEASPRGEFQLSEQIEISTSQTAQDTWKGKEIWVTASCTLTIPAPSTLSVAWNIDILVFPSVILTLAITSGGGWLHTTPTPVSDAFFRIARRGNTTTFKTLGL